MIDTSATNFNFNLNLKEDWGLGIGDWGSEIGDWDRDWVSRIGIGDWEDD